MPLLPCATFSLHRLFPFLPHPRHPPRSHTGSDPLLREFVKGEQPFLPHPPFRGLTGWRDPFLIGRPGDGRHDRWAIIFGSGFDRTGPSPDKQAGAALVYTSEKPTSGWEYVKPLCVGDGSTGGMWECPLMARVPVHPSASKDDAASLLQKDGEPTYVLMVCPDNPWTPKNVAVYYLGQYNPKELSFDIKNAAGPNPADLGDHTFYAANVLTNDPKGRLVLFGWIQETGRYPGKHEYSACLSLPRMLWLHPSAPGRLWQEPLDVLVNLRKASWLWQGAPKGVGLSAGWRQLTAEGHAPPPTEATTSAPAQVPPPEVAHPGGEGGKMPLVPGQSVTLPPEVRNSQHLEIEVTLHPPEQLVSGKVAKSGILFRSAPLTTPPTEGEACGRFGAALLYDWRNNRLDVVYPDATVPLEKLCDMPLSGLKSMSRAAHVFVSSHGSDAYEDVDVGKDPEMHEVAYTPIHGTEEHAGMPHETTLHQPIDIRGCHAIGGHLRNMPKTGALRPIRLRIFLDFSLVEAFTSTGIDVGEKSSATNPRVFAILEPASVGIAASASDVRVQALGMIWGGAEGLADLEQKLGARHATAHPAAL
ncbi:glycosyl hydrolase [Dunaliella salina]|uniref:Glycosyl hydrolase n=1 Tax=Dunaliella salina TaxID=3046 RepID=A0ABQ7GB23_DUNSA|nr:glycosyl hydrolase [Dunaliella salina]|eukprot:KAF5831773.1 glycosyl hydrolase [Dunaliella salina]